MLSRLQCVGGRVRLRAHRTASGTTAQKTSPAFTLLDLPSLLATHGDKFADILNEDLSITSESFQQSLRSLLHHNRYSEVVDINNNLPHLHRLVIPDHNMTFATMAAYGGLKKPLKARKLAKLVAQSPKGAQDMHTAASLLLATYAGSDKMDSCEAILFTWIRSHLSASPDDQHTAALSQLLTTLDNGRGLPYTTSSKELDVTVLHDDPPGMRVWFSLSSMYCQRGAWVQSQAILRYLEHTERLHPTVTAAGKPLHLSPLFYHHTIVALVGAQGFAPAVSLYQELQQKAKESEDSFKPHPLTFVPLLQVLSLWKEVTHVGTLIAVCEEVAQISIALSRMTDENFQRMHASGSAGLTDEDRALQWMPERDICTVGTPTEGAVSWRLQTLDALLSTLFRSLGPHRGLNKFSSDLADHLRANGVELPLHALVAMIEGRARANNWQGALELYPQLDAALASCSENKASGQVPALSSFALNPSKLAHAKRSMDVERASGDSEWDGKRARGSLAYHWIAEAMLRDGATEALADFLVRENI
mmetsp:Transcript_1053/g.2214  ORF Transcript_1053/g.2214 Transcript_1053/m.2214 type:complete len:534 (+) Transcript_1053:80-1681(+)